MHNITNDIANSSSHIFLVLNKVSDIIGIYFITVITSIGCICNFMFLILVSHKSLKHKFYDCLWTKAFCDLIVSIIGIGYLNNACVECIKDRTYWALFYNLYMIKIPLRIALVASTYTEIYLILNRLISLFKPKSTFLYFNKWLFLFCIYFFVSLVCLPFVFTLEIVKETNDDDQFIIIQKSQSGFIGFIIISLCFVQLVPMILLIVLNLMSIIKYRMTITKLKKMKRDFSSAGDKLESRFSRTIIIVSCVFFFIKLCSLISFLLSSLSLATIIETNFQSLSIINFTRQISFLLNFIFHVLNGIFYIHMDSNLRKILF